MKLLTFQARRFAWKTHSKTLEEAPDEDVSDEVRDAVVVFMHADAKDTEPEERRRVFRHALKHVKWIANKRGLENVVLHSFTHLGAETAPPDFAVGFIEELSERLRGTGYRVSSTPFGWFCSWDLEVFGDSLSKVWKET